MYLISSSSGGGGGTKSSANADSSSSSSSGISNPDGRKTPPSIYHPHHDDEHHHLLLLLMTKHQRPPHEESPHEEPPHEEPPHEEPPHEGPPHEEPSAHRAGNRYSDRAGSKKRAKKKRLVKAVKMPPRRQAHGGHTTSTSTPSTSHLILAREFQRSQQELFRKLHVLFSAGLLERVRALYFLPQHPPRHTAATPATPTEPSSLHMDFLHPAGCTAKGWSDSSSGGPFSPSRHTFEVLEFLGDSVLQFRVSRHLTRSSGGFMRPHMLTQIRSHCVCNETLSRVYDCLSMHRMFPVAPMAHMGGEEVLDGSATTDPTAHQLSRRTLTKRKADTVEALVGELCELMAETGGHTATLQAHCHSTMEQLIGYIVYVGQADYFMSIINHSAGSTAIPATLSNSNSNSNIDIKSNRKSNSNSNNKSRNKPAETKAWERRSKQVRYITADNVDGTETADDADRVHDVNSNGNDDKVHLDVGDDNNGRDKEGPLIAEDRTHILENARDNNRNSGEKQDRHSPHHKAVHKQGDSEKRKSSRGDKEGKIKSNPLITPHMLTFDRVGLSSKEESRRYSTALANPGLKLLLPGDGQSRKPYEEHAPTTTATTTATTNASTATVPLTNLSRLYFLPPSSLSPLVSSRKRLAEVIYTGDTIPQSKMVMRENRNEKLLVTPQDLLPPPESYCLSTGKH